MENIEYVKVYCNNRSYINKVKNNYIINHALLHNDKVMLLIYTYEWFKIPKQNNFEKVIYHPFLTKKDQILVEELKTRYIFKLCLFTGIYLLISNGLFIRRFQQKPKIILFNLSNIAIASLLAYSFWNIYLYPRLNEEVPSVKELTKYLELNVDLEKIIQELVNYNIKLI
jgi:hypothetical protein